VAPLFTILLAVNRPPVSLPYAIETVLAQTVADLELFIVCDGATSETVDCAQDFAQRDSRISVLAFPKGENIGEAYWHTALGGASGSYVAHIEDDDLWFPNHLEELEKLLQTVDFGHVIHVRVNGDGNIEALPSNLAIPEFRKQLLDERYNRFGFTVAGYRLDAYRRLAEGWAPSPPGVWPDLHMWRKFLRQEEFRFGTRMVVTTIGLPSFWREGVTPEQRAEESRVWLDRILDPRKRVEIIEAAWRSIVDQDLQFETAVRVLNASLYESQSILERTSAEYAQSRAELVSANAAHAQLRAEHAQLRAEVEPIIQSRLWRVSCRLQNILTTIRQLGRSDRR